jgi:glutaminyl-peptide cyclotransferase
MRVSLPRALAIVSLLAGCGRDDKIWNEFSGEKALAHVQRLVELGPRPAGSEALEKTRAYITQQLKGAGWTISRQTFTAQTPRGAVTFANLIADWPGSKASSKFLFCAHYDTKLFETFRFVGANDGASGTAVLLELARVLATESRLASRCQLVFFDGEEAFENFSETDGLYGSRHFAEDLTRAGKTNFYRAGVLFDMVGDKSLRVTLPPDSPQNLARDIFAAADALKLREHFTYFDRDITDDHTPLNAAGIPVIDLIDFEFPTWHTAEDTMEQISAESLRIVGQIALYHLVHLDWK